MSAPSFTVKTSPAFERLLRKLNRQHPDLVKVYSRVITILELDPYNHTRRNAIKKMTKPQGRGQYRLRLGRWRFRYDIIERDVVLEFCGLRREDTYR